MRSGVYQILNIVNGKCYVGSAVDLLNRWRVHRGRLDKNIHSKKLQNAWNKHGALSFEFMVLEYCSKDEVVYREQYWMDFLDSFRNGYNTRRIATSNLGIRMSDETKRKHSIRSKGRKMSEENKKKQSERCKGVPLPEAHRIKISLANTGKPGFFKGKTHSEETKQKIRNTKKRNPSPPSYGMLGKTVSEETRRKMSEAQKGRPPTKGNIGQFHSEESKTKMSLASKGKPKSEEHKRNISKAKKIYYEQKRNNHV